jgi:hypothetical protein
MRSMADLYALYPGSGLVLKESGSKSPHSAQIIFSTAISRLARPHNNPEIKGIPLYGKFGNGAIFSGSC